MSRSRTPRARLLLVAFASALGLGADDAEPLSPAEELRRLEETGMRQAREALQAGDELGPFAFVVRSDGRTQRLAPKASRRRRTPKHVVASLIEGLGSRARAGDYRAVAVFRYVVIALSDERESHAIHVGMEHASGRCEEVFVPYHEGDDDEPRFETELRRPREAEIFAHCDAPPP